MRAGNFSDAFAKILRSERETKGLTQEGLALKAGLTRQYVGMIERGERKPTLEASHSLARVLRVPLLALIRATEAASAKLP